MRQENESSLAKELTKQFCVILAAVVIIPSVYLGVEYSVNKITYKKQSPIGIGAGCGGIGMGIGRAAGAIDLARQPSGALLGGLYNIKTGKFIESDAQDNK